MEDVETVIEENSNLQYFDKQNNEFNCQQITVISITTDEGVLRTFRGRRTRSRGSILETTGTNKCSRPSPFNIHRRLLWLHNYILVAILKSMLSLMVKYGNYQYSTDLVSLRQTILQRLLLMKWSLLRGVSRRGRRAFNDSLAPGEWSLSTYVRPFTSAGSGNGAADGAAETHAVEEVLWAMMAGADNYDASTYDFDRGGSNVITPASSSSAISFDQSNKSTLGTANIYFVMGDANRTVMKLKDAVVNEASIDFEIDGIATIAWSGQCSEVVDFTANTIEAATLPSNGDLAISGNAVAVGDVWLDSDDTHRLYVTYKCTLAVVKLLLLIQSTKKLLIQVTLFVIDSQLLL